MGLTGSSTGAGLLGCCGLCDEREKHEDKIIALAGNPNVGKSTVFNSLTGLNQHTGNWPGKTVTNARGKYRYRDRSYTLVDIPGTYSLMANSAEEEIARDFICFGEPDAVVVVADATCLERNLNLVLQTMEITDNVILCVNLMDEAKKKRISINLALLSERLGIPVAGTSARSGKGLDSLMEAVRRVTESERTVTPLRTTYEDEIERAVSTVASALGGLARLGGHGRWFALKLLEGDESLLASLKAYLGYDVSRDETVARTLLEAWDALEKAGITPGCFRDRVVSEIVRTCELICRDAVSFEKRDYARRDRTLDRVLTSKLTGIPIMILLLFGVFWLTITGANYPSGWLADGLFWIEGKLTDFFLLISAPDWLRGVLVDGMYRTLAWVVSVMLPPMAIFFPLFTLLEDSGYLPRIAFNLDNFFRKACAHGKQALTM